MFDIDDGVRCISGYSKIPNEEGYCLQVVEYEFEKPVSLAFLQRLFNVNPEHPDEGERYLIDPYRLNNETARALQPYVKEKLDLDKYDFELTCYDKKSYEKWKKEQTHGNSQTVEKKEKMFCVEGSGYGQTPEIVYFKFKRPITELFLRQLLNAEKEKYFSFYELNLKQVKALQPYVEGKLDTNKYDFTLRHIFKWQWEAWQKVS